MPLTLVIGTEIITDACFKFQVCNLAWSKHSNELVSIFFGTCVIY